MSSSNRQDARPLTGKVALVTGSSRGIGRAIAERLARDGAAVVVNYTQAEEQARATVDAIVQAGGKAIALRADVSQPQAVRELFAATLQAFGHLDIVVANAGTTIFKPHVHVSEDEFDRVFGLNARGTFFVLQEAARHVGAGGRIVAMSSGGTQGKFPAAGLYLASKASVEFFAGALAKELGPRGVTVNVVSPGLTETDGMIMPKEMVDQAVRSTPLGRMGRPDDVAAAVAFLVGVDGGWVTGHNLLASGGL